MYRWISRYYRFVEFDYCTIDGVWSACFYIQKENCGYRCFSERETFEDISIQLHFVMLSCKTYLCLPFGQISKWLMYKFSF